MTISRQSESNREEFRMIYLVSGLYREVSSFPMSYANKRLSTRLDTFTQTLSLDDSKHYKARKYMVAT